MNKLQKFHTKFVFKKSIVCCVVLAFFSCKTAIPRTEKKPLYEVLLRQNDGGGNINFYEILSEANEIKMLLKDDKLKGKVNSNDVNQSNFVVLNMGEKPTSGYALEVDKVVETDTQIIIEVKEIKPEPGAMLMQVISYPYTIVKINSKKEIIVK